MGTEMIVLQPVNCSVILVLPEGSLDYQITLARSSTTRGEKLLDLGVSYNSRPNPAVWTPSSSELSNWGEMSSIYLTIHPLETTRLKLPWIACLK